MIAKLFYPKELKEIVVALREKDDLNEEAVSRLDRIIYKGIRSGIILCAFLSLFLFNDEVREFFVLPMILIFLCIFIFIALDLKKLFRKVIPLYNLGRYASGTCVVYSDGGSLYNPYGFFLKVQANIDGATVISTLRANNFTRDRNLYQEGDHIPVAYDPNNPENNIPVTKSFSDVFYLRKKVLNDH